MIWNQSELPFTARKTLLYGGYLIQSDFTEKAITAQAILESALPIAGFGISKGIARFGSKGVRSVSGEMGNSRLALPTGKAPSGSSLVIEHSPNPKVKFSDSELRAANYMYEQGNQVVLRHPVGTRADGGTSDLLVNGVRYDVYTPTTSNLNRIISSMAGKNSQTTGIVLDLSQTPVTTEQLGNALQRVRGIVEAGGKTPNITDIVIMP
ncbi:hypothetical protein D1872_242490 [compost metagenome]